MDENKIDNLINKISKSGFYRGQVKKVIKLPPMEPIYADGIDFSPEIKKYLSHCGIERLYTHQAEAIECIRQGKNTVITTPTASGKTLAFNIPVAEAIQKDGITALYVYPAKALSNDQLAVLEELKKGSGIKLTAGIYDGDTDAEKKKFLRNNADIILTNPYELHQVLPFHSKWKKFYSRLKFVVLDEAHKYRGVHGSNIAFLIRRLKRILNIYGSHPQFILSTASLANPLEFAEKLTGMPFSPIAGSGSPVGEKSLVMWDSSQYPDKSAHTQAKDILLFSAKNGFQTLAFTTSRRMAELIRMWANKEDKKLEILSYRSGYSPSTRREIEKKLKDGKIKGVVSTNALELGMDIGKLDVIIISGYPGTISSFWQQAGRAGRKMQASAVFYLPYEDALQKYLLRNPGILTDMKFESAVISLENPNITTGHVLCAVSESPSPGKNVFEDSPVCVEICDNLIEHGLLKETPRGIIYSGSVRPQDAVSLDSAGGKNIKIKVDGRILEEISLERAYREAHSGAVYLHNGETYVIKELRLEEGTAYAAKEAVDYYTETLKNEEVRIMKVKKSRIFDGYKLFTGNVSVTETYKGFRVKKAGNIILYEDLLMPPLNFNSEAVWIELDHRIKEKIDEMKLDFDGAIHAAEHALIALSPLFAMCDENDLGGMSYPAYEDGGAPWAEPTEPQTKGDIPEAEGQSSRGSDPRPSAEWGNPVIFIYDGYEGGIGISEKLYEVFEKLNEKTIGMIEACSCDIGCPSCVYAARCGNNNNPIDKRGAVELLKMLI
jgi:DEAD/DEAH box helicase domain-containing protein